MAGRSWCVSVGSRKVRLGKAVLVGLGQVRYGQSWSGGCGTVGSGSVRRGEAGSGKAGRFWCVVEWRGMVSRGRARQGGYGNVCLVETSCVMAWSGGRGVFRWGGLAFGEAVNFKRRSK